MRLCTIEVEIRSNVSWRNTVFFYISMISSKNGSTTFLLKDSAFHEYCFCTNPSIQFLTSAVQRNKSCRKCPFSVEGIERGVCNILIKNSSVCECVCYKYQLQLLNYEGDLYFFEKQIFKAKGLTSTCTSFATKLKGRMMQIWIKHSLYTPTLSWEDV